MTTSHTRNSLLTFIQENRPAIIRYQSKVELLRTVADVRQAEQALRQEHQATVESLQTLNGELDQAMAQVAQLRSQIAALNDRLSHNQSALSSAAEQVRCALKDKGDARDAYLSLMEKCLTGRIYEDPPLAIFDNSGFDSERRDSGLDWPSRAHTMIGTKRLHNLRELVENVITDRIPGDFIETGVWRGGACILMRALLQAHGENGRRVWVADSFEGLPPPNPKQYPADEGDDFHTYKELAISLETVKDNFLKYGLLDDQVVFLKGWFKDTLPNAPIERLALLRLDGDMYESTLDALNSLYDKLSYGGYVIVDDYHVVEGCRKAVHDFLDARGITPKIHEIDGVGVYWRNTESGENPVWISDEIFKIRDTRFVMMTDPDALKSAQISPDDLLLGKNRQLIETMVGLKDSGEVKRIVDLGIFKGGSMALYALLFKPIKLVGLDHAPETPGQLSKFIDHYRFGDRLRTYYGVSQADSVRLREIVQVEFGDAELDLIVDDASHLYPETRASFNVLFPRLRPGGIYIIEDWGWAHWPGDLWQKSQAFPAEAPSLTNLLIEISMLCASSHEIIQSVEVTFNTIWVRRGPGYIDPENFSLEGYCLNRGKTFKAEL